MNIRKVLAGSLAAMAAGATVAFGAFAQTNGLGDYVDNSGSTPVAPWVIIGSGNGNPEYAKDVVGAADLAAGVAGFATKARAIGGTAEVSVSGGVSLSTANKKIFAGDAINTAKDTLTEDDLPSILASGTFEDDDGNTYDYDQYIVVGSSVAALSNSGDDLDDPAQIIQIGTTAGTPAYTLRIVFNDDLNFSDSDVDGNTIDLFGTPYTISSDSDTDTLVLFGGANKQTLTEGETATVDVGGVSYEVTLMGVSDTDTAVVKVNDQSRSIDEGQSRRVAGLDVFVDEVFFLSKESQVSSTKLSFGSSEVTFDNGDEISVGSTDPVDIDNTLVTFTQGNDGTSVLEIKVAAQDDDEDHVSADDPFTDPVFGTFKLAFNGGSPTLAEMEMFEFDTSGDDTATVKFTDDGGEEATVEFGFDPTPGTAGTTLQLADNDGDAIIVVEGMNATEDDYIVINQDDFSHLLEVTKIDTTTGDGSDGTLELKDVFSGTTYEVNMDETGTDSGVFNGTKVIDGKTYIFWSSDVATDTMAVVWDSGAQADAVGVNTGNTLSVFPTLVAAKDAEVAFIDNSNIGTFVNGTGNTVEIFGISISNFPNGSQTISGTNIDIEYHASTGILEVESVTDPSVLILEEEGEDANGDDIQNAVIVETSDNSDGITIQTGASTPIFTAAVNSGYLDTSDSDVEIGADRYGTTVEKNTDSSSQGDATVYYPDNQVIMAVGIGASPVFSVSGESGTVQEAYQITTPIAKLASEISNPSTLNRDVILVGGPCANALVATLMDVSMDWPACSEADDLSGLNEGVIKSYANAFSSGQKALVVAGMDADDTRALAAKALTGTTSYSA